MASSGLLPMGIEAYKKVIGESTQAQKASLKGFNLGLQSIENQKQQLAYLDSVLNPTDSYLNKNQISSSGTSTLPNERKERYPKAVHDFLDLAFQRVKSYQNQAYAELFLSRLDRICDAEQKHQSGSHVVTLESLKHFIPERLMFCKI